MFEFSLLKSLFFELDKYKMDGVTETKDRQQTFRRIEVSYPNAPGITSITAEERILPYVDRYYFYVNDEEVPCDVKEYPASQAVYEFYKEHFPEYLKKDIPQDMREYPILDAFEVFHMPDYRPKHAFPGLVTLEDIRNGNVHDEDRPKYAFPGLEMLGSRKVDDGKPMAAQFEGYTEFGGDRDKAMDKLAQMKKQFASQLKDLPIPDEEEEQEMSEEQ